MHCMQASALAVVFCLALVATRPLAAEVRDISNGGLIALQEKGVPIIDVRTPHEWFKTGVVPGSMLLTFFDEQGSYDMERWLTTLGDYIDYMQPFVLVCDVGVRTEAISRVLSNQLKLPVVYNLKLGIRSWINEGHETVAPPHLIRIPENEEERKR